MQKKLSDVTVFFLGLYSSRLTSFFEKRFQGLDNPFLKELLLKVNLTEVLKAQKTLHFYKLRLINQH